jgi:drug/metabolite transporter (DMT)-like permease
MAFGASVLSTSGVLARNFEAASSWQIVFVRALSLATALCILYAARYRGSTGQELKAAVYPALALGPIHGMGSACFILALTHTSVASVMLVLSAIPLFAAGLAWLLLGERITPATVVSIGAAMLGVGIVMFDGLMGGTLLGDLLALANSLSFALFVVIARSRRSVDMTPAIIVGALVGAAVAAVASPDLHMSAHDVLLCIIWGAVVQCVGLLATLFAARHLPAAHVCLIGLLEYVLAPTWAWLFVGEVPAISVVIGATTVLASVVVWVYCESLRGKPTAIAGR